MYFDRLIPAAYIDAARLRVAMVVGDEGVEVRCQHDLTRLCVCLQAGTDVDRVTKCGEVDNSSRSDVADEGYARAGGYADGKVVDGDREVDGGQRSLAAIVGSGQSANEQSMTSSPISLSTRPSWRTSTSVAVV